jgi:hypothetical protein
VKAGQNMTVVASTNSTGGTEYTVATADDVTFKNVTAQNIKAIMLLLEMFKLLKLVLMLEIK